MRSISDKRALAREHYLVEKTTETYGIVAVLTLSLREALNVLLVQAALVFQLHCRLRGAHLAAYCGLLVILG